MGCVLFVSPRVVIVIVVAVVVARCLLFRHFQVHTVLLERVLRTQFVRTIVFTKKKCYLAWFKTQKKKKQENNNIRTIFTTYTLFK